MLRVQQFVWGGGSRKCTPPAALGSVCAALRTLPLPAGAAAANAASERLHRAEGRGGECARGVRPWFYSAFRLPPPPLCPLAPSSALQVAPTFLLYKTTSRWP